MLETYFHDCGRIKFVNNAILGIKAAFDYIVKLTNDLFIKIILCFISLLFNHIFAIEGINSI